METRGLAVFVLLTILPEVFAQNRHISTLKLTLDTKFTSLLPTVSTYYLAEYENVSQQECFRYCLHGSPGCIGTLVNVHTRSCKLLDTHLNGITLDWNKPVKGWTFWGNNKECEAGWIEFEGRHYLYREDRLKWKKAKAECQKVCSHLVEIESVEESEWLARTFRLNDNCHVGVPCADWRAWIGGNDLQSEGRFVWDYSNTTVNFTNWSKHEPSLSNATLALSRDCIELTWNGKWINRPCRRRKTYICEK